MDAAKAAGTPEFAIEASGPSKDRMSCCSTALGRQIRRQTRPLPARTTWRRGSRRLPVRIALNCATMTCLPLDQAVFSNILADRRGLPSCLNSRAERNAAGHWPSRSPQHFTPWHGGLTSLESQRFAVNGLFVSIPSVFDAPM